MAIMFDLCDAIINGSGILAQNASISSSNSLEEVRSVGKRGIASIIPNGPIKNTFNYDYLFELNYAPDYDQVALLKNWVDDGSWTGAVLEIGGITGRNCYLESYSVRAQPNDLVRASVGYVSFSPLSGQIHQKTAGITYNAETAVANGWSIYVTSSGNYITGRTAGFSYDFNADWQPTYLFGQTYPSQVTLLGASERMSFVRDSFTQIQHSGQTATGFMGNTDNLIDLYQISIVCTGGYTGRLLTFDISGAKVTNTDLSVAVNDYLKTNVEVVNYY